MSEHIVDTIQHVHQNASEMHGANLTLAENKAMQKHV